MKSRITRLRWAIGLIWAAALLLRLLVFVSIAHEPRKFYTYDSDGYDRRAVNLLYYGVFASEARPPLHPDLDRTPLYPGMLAAVFAVAGHTPAVAIALQILLGSLTPVLVFVLARELRLAAVAGLIAAAIVALDPVAALTANQLLTETLFTLLLTASIWLLVRFWRTDGWRWLLLAAVLMALATLTRPISQFLPLALLPLFALAARRARLRAVVTAGLLFVVVSTVLAYTWAYRNARETGIFTLSTIGDTNLIYYRARAVLADAKGVSQTTAWTQLETQINTTAAQQQLTPAQKIGLERQQALTIFQRYPRQTVVMLVKGTGRLLVDPGFTLSCTLLDRTSTSFDCFPGESTMDNPGVLGVALGKFVQLSRVQQLTLAWGVLLLALLYAGALGGVVGLVRQRRWLPLALALIVIVYFVALSSGAESGSRFRIPIMPFLALLAGVGIQVLIAPRVRNAWLAVRQHPAQRQSPAAAPAESRS